MKKGLQEWPLVAFTLAAQTAVGMLAWLALLSLLKSPQPIGPLAAGSWALALAVSGLLASLLHLGNPQRAFMAIRRINKSWISREVVLAVAFCLSTAGLTVFSLLSPPFSTSTAWLLWISTLLGVGLVYAMAQVYQLRTAPGWPGRLTGPGFFLTSLLLGGSLLAWLAAPAWLALRTLPPESNGSLFRLGLLTCLTLQAGLVLLGPARLTQLEAPKHPGGWHLTLLRVGLLLAALTALVFSQALISTALIVTAELVGRITFYAARSRLGV